MLSHCKGIHAAWRLFEGSQPDLRTFWISGFSLVRQKDDTEESVQDQSLEIKRASSRGDGTQSYGSQSLPVHKSS